ncbi:hypothetical protein OIO90_002019 [Microbotryomycetes sp. JL221]|nr:hypothetical protein OIO90_002019 [Microbotryomycetes sp. JL221]
MWPWSRTEQPRAEPDEATEAIASAEARRGDDNDLTSMRRRTFERLVQEELPVQRASLAMQGGPPSCMTLFDEFFSCFSLGNQARALYRYGHARDCSPKFEDFKFCLSIKALTDEQKEQVWVNRRAEMWAKRRLGPSSEDVWTAKTGVYEQVERRRRADAAQSD